MKLRPATEHDAQLLFDWRNDPETRTASHNSDEIAIGEHMNWLIGILLDENRELFIAELEGAAVGVARIDDIKGNRPELSWTVAPNCRGRGIGIKLVAELVNVSGGPVRAEIKNNNIASVRIAKHVGLSLVGQDGDIMHFEAN